MSRLTLTILAAAGITLFAGVLFYFGAFSAPASPQGNLAAVNPPTAAAPANNHYYDATYHFSFDYPADATVQYLPNDEADVILVTRPGQGVEIHIMPSDLPAITEADIRNEPGDSLISGPTRSLLTDGIPLLRAEVSFADIGPVLHAWFFRRGNQYELMAQTKAGALLDNILKSWCFHDAPLYPGQHCVGYPLP